MGARMVYVKLYKFHPCSLGGVPVWLQGPIFFLLEPEPFDVVKDAIPACDGSLYFVQIVLLICLNVSTLAQYSFVIDWAVALHKGFQFRNVERGVSFHLWGSVSLSAVGVMSC